MKKQEYEYLVECFDKLLYDYHCAQAEITGLRETIQILENICRINNIEVPNLKDSEPF